MTRKDEIHLDFGLYEKYISKGFATREIAASDRKCVPANVFAVKRQQKELLNGFQRTTKRIMVCFNVKSMV